MDESLSLHSRGVSSTDPTTTTTTTSMPEVIGNRAYCCAGRTHRFFPNMIALSNAHCNLLLRLNVYPQMSIKNEAVMT